MTPTSVLEAAVGPPLHFSDSLYEGIDGQRVELPPMGIRECLIANALGMELALLAPTHQLGWAVGEMVFRLPHLARQRRPDVAFVSYQSWPRTRPVPQGAAWSVVPELAIEVVSPSNTA